MFSGGTHNNTKTYILEYIVNVEYSVSIKILIFFASQGTKACQITTFWHNEKTLKYLLSRMMISEMTTKMCHNHYF